MKEVTSNYNKAIGKHGAKETSTENYVKAQRRKYAAMFGEQTWAHLDREAKDDDGDSDDEFFRVRRHNQGYMHVDSALLIITHNRARRTCWSAGSSRVCRAAGSSSAS